MSPSQVHAPPISFVGRCQGPVTSDGCVPFLGPKPATSSARSCSEIVLEPFACPSDAAWEREAKSQKSRSRPDKLASFNLSDFKLDEQIGEGSFAEVYSAHMKLGEQHGGASNRVALKVAKSAEQLGPPPAPMSCCGCAMRRRALHRAALAAVPAPGAPDACVGAGLTPESEVTYDDVLYAVRQEADIIQRLGRHPNIVHVLGAARKRTILVMQLAVTDLNQLVRRARQQGQPLPLSSVRTWSRDILAGVAHVHAMGTVHMDVKSGNVLIDARGNAVLTDFGLAILGSGRMEVDRELMTLWYRAPELLMGRTTFRSNVDSWGAGCVVLEMLLGAPPFRGDPDMVCRCASVLHANYNSDQLQRIFKVVGTPPPADLDGCHTVEHFGAWEPQPRVLEHLIAAERSPCPPAGSDAARTLRGLADLVAALLQLVPERRLSPEEALAAPVMQQPQGAAQAAPAPAHRPMPAAPSGSSGSMARTVADARDGFGRCRSASVCAAAPAAKRPPLARAGRSPRPLPRAPEELSSSAAAAALALAEVALAEEAAAAPPAAVPPASGPATPPLDQGRGPAGVAEGAAGAPGQGRSGGWARWAGWVSRRSRSDSL